MIKLFLIFVLSLTLSSMVFSQEKDTIQVVEKCNEEDFIKAIYSGIKYPFEAIDNKEEGKVFAQFQVDYDGKVDSIKIAKGIGGSCDRIVLERIQFVADSMKFIHCKSRKLPRKDFKHVKRIIPFIFLIDNLDSIRESHYKTVLGSVTKKEWPNKNPHQIRIKLPNKAFEYGDSLAFKVQFSNLSKKPWKLSSPDTSFNVKFYFFAENDTYKYPIEPKNVSRIGVQVSATDYLNRYEKALNNSSQGTIESITSKDESAQLSIDSLYTFTAFLPKPHSFEIGQKYYCWITYKDENNRIVSNTIGFRVKLTNKSIEKLIAIKESKSENFLKANQINSDALFYRLRGPAIHKEEQIKNSDWDKVYAKASIRFKDWWLKNKDSDYLKRILSEINQGKQ